MHQHRLIILLVVCYCCFASGSLLHAQQTEDYRLSSDPLEYRLPQDVQIQSAGDVEGKTLVVWGTMVESDDGVIPALVLHINGTQRLLSSESARPYGVVSVVPLADRFLVLWNDRRDDSAGIYSAVIDVAGNTIVSEVLVRLGGVMAEQPRWLVGSHRVQVLWNDSRGRDTTTYNLGFSLSGTVEVNAVQLSAQQMDSRQSYSLSEGGFLVRYVDGGGRIIRPDGAFDARLVPVGRLDVPHYFLNDSSIAIVKDSTFYIYRSLFDTEAERMIALPYGAPKATALSRDSVGWFLLSHTSQSISWGAQVLETRRYFDPEDLSTANTVFIPIDTVHVPTNSMSTRSARFDVYTVLTTEQNVVRFEITASTTYYDYGGVPPVISSDFINYDIRGIDAFPKTDPSATELTVSRNDSLLHSSVRVIHHANADTTIFSAKFPAYLYRLLYQNPSVAVRNGVLVAGWQGTDDSLRSVRITGEFSIEPNVAQRTPRKALQFWPWGSITTLHSNPVLHAVLQNYTWVNSGYEEMWSLQDSGWRYSRAPVLAQNYSGRSGDGPEPQHISAAVGPTNTRAFSLTYFSSVQRSPTRALHRIYSVRLDDTSSGVEWETTVPVARVGMIPLDSVSAILFTALDTACVVRKDGVGSCFYVKPRLFSERERFYRLTGPRFLRVFSDTASPGITLELYDFKGNVLATKELPFSNLDEKSVVLPRTSDGSIVVLGGGPSGVRLTYLDKNLHEFSLSSGEVLTDIRVSGTSDSVARPSGVFRGDALVIVWEDYRRGEGSDIYATQWNIPKGLETVGGETTDTTEIPPEITVPAEPLESGFRILGVSPNPSVGSVKLTVESAERRAVSVSIYDALGQRVLHHRAVFSSGRTGYWLNLSGLRSGRYEVVIASGTERVSRGITVYGE